MEYYQLLNLKKEPFSNSPDPNYLFQSRQHRLCLQRLELSIRLKRGLNVVVGEVGTGKTTLCRQLLLKFGKDDTFESYLILEPQVRAPGEFLQAIAAHLDAEGAGNAETEAALKEIIKHHLFESGVEKDKTIVLIIDEGQKMPPFCLEIIRELLNYETNEYKLLQIIVFAQPEFDAVLENHANVADRISMRHELRPMGYRDTKLMIAYRLHQAGLTQRAASPFSFLAILAIYKASGGYPRKIVNLCHQCVLALLIQNRKRAGWSLVRSCVTRMRMDPENRLGKAGWSIGAAGAMIAILAIMGVVWMPGALTAPEKPLMDPSPASVRVLHGTPPATRPMPAPAVDSAAAPAVSEKPDEAETDPGLAATGGSPDQAPVPPVAAVSLPATPPAATAGLAAPDTGASDAPASVPSLKAETTVSSDVATPVPDIVGVAILQRSEMLSWLMIKIYGDYSKDLLNRILAMNPGIKNPNAIEAGKRIVFPALPVSISRAYAGNWWVSLADVNHFEAALTTVRRYPPYLAPVRIVPYWSNAQGLRFRVVLWEYFSTETDAMAAAAAVPVMDDGPATVAAGWPEQSVLYADPFSGSRK